MFIRGYLLGEDSNGWWRSGWGCPGCGVVGEEDAMVRAGASIWKDVLVCLEVDSAERQVAGRCEALLFEMNQCDNVVGL